MNILVIGATGFTGKRVLNELHTSPHSVGIYARSTSDVSLAKKWQFKIHYGDLKDLENLKKALAQYDGLISVASLGFDYSANIIEAASQQKKLKRSLFVSTTGIFTRLNPESKKIRLANEYKIISSVTKWTIVRPTMIYGGPDDRNMSRLLKFIKQTPIVPIPGNGNSLMQPIFVDDLAKNIVNLFNSNAAVNKAYNLSGQDALSFNGIINEAESVLGVKRLKVHLPINLVLPPLQLVEKFVKNPFLKSEQILRLLEDKAFSSEDAVKDVNFDPIPIKQGLTYTAKACGLIQ